ncbi:metal ABC transporter ATP-binding protein [Hyperthermus butylicus]|nr:metal ABC transporter ATP-binding protein [Hyperthermus butylicus]
MECREPSIVLDNVAVSYGGDPVLVVDHLELRGPALVQVLGPNGAGKTTLIRTILGLIKPLRGRVTVCGRDVTGNPAAAGRLTGYVPQLARTLTHFPVTSWELIEFEYLLRIGKKPRLLASAEDKTMVEAVLRQVGLGRETWSKPISKMSGGQRQRTLIARALVHDPPILLMDEPFSAVDPQGRCELARLIAKLAKDKLIVVTSHDPMLLIDYTDYIVLVNKRIVAHGKPSEVLRVEILRKVYGEAAIPVARHIHISDSHILI